MNRCFAVIAVLLGATVACADDWPAWRGPTGQGECFEKNLPAKWSATENVKWKIKLEHPGYSTPIVWKDKIFLTLATPKGETRSLLCFDRADGKRLWKKDVPFAGKEMTWQGNYPYCHASPVTDGERVVVSFGSAGLHCFDLNGKALWSRTDLGKWEDTFGNSASPVLHGDLCIQWCGPNRFKGRNFMLAVDKKTGKTVWEHDEKAGSWGTPTLAKTIDGKEQLLYTADYKFRSLDPKDGKPLWTCDGLTIYVYTSPLYSPKHNIAVAMSGFNGAALAVKLGGKGDITKDRLWHHPQNTQRVGSGLIIDDHVYIVEENGAPHCYELTTGKEVWKAEKRPADKTWGSMVHADGKLWVLMRDGSTVIFKASPKYELLEHNSLGAGQTTNASLAISNGAIFIRTDQNLWCIGAKK